MNTVILPLPTAARSAAGSVACSSVALTYVVVRLLPFHSAVEDCTKPVPLIVTVVAAAPTSIVDGESEVIDGTGFD